MAGERRRLWLTIPPVPIQPPLSQAPADGYFRIYGFVKDDTGNPIPGVCVSGRPWGYNGKEAYYVTDSSGFYFIDWVKWKDVIVKPAKPGYSSNGFALKMGPPVITGEGGPMIVTRNSPKILRIEDLPEDGMVQLDLTLTLVVPKPVPQPTPKPAPVPNPNPAPKPNYGLFHYSSYNLGTVNIFLDGRFLGANPIYNIPVSVGWHRLLVVTPGGMVITDKNLYMNPGGRWVFN